MSDENFVYYLADLSKRCAVSVETAHQAQNLWSELTVVVPQLLLPNASPMEEGGFSMSWSNAGHHTEIEIDASGDMSWFCRDRNLNTSDGGDWHRNGCVPPELIERLRNWWSDGGGTER